MPNDNLPSGRDPATGLFVPGNKGGTGRPIGARKKLSSKFVMAMLEAFTEIDEKTGYEAGYLAITRVRDNDPSTYIKALAALLPKEVTGEDGAPLLTGLTVKFVRPPLNSEL